ncbi:MAG: glycosyltransferase family 39 protein [Deltaproteobacteria bacterium]|nr:glycosyltransferase family 39 protein [Candidatus Zymogenaceae bacterium]
MSISGPKKTSTAPYALLAVILLISIVPYFWGLGKADIQDVDESTYAEIAREMVASGNWISPTLNGVPFDQHPPLVTWLMAASIKLFGATPLAARLPNALLALAGLLIIYAIGKRIADKETGIAAALALVTTPAYHLMVRDARLDMALMVFIAFSLWGIISYLYEPKKYYLVLAYLASALAFLTKGPIGLVIPILVTGVFIIMTRRWNLILRLGLPWGLALVAVILFPWYWAMYRAHGSHYLYVLFIVQNFDRFGTTNHAMKTDPFYYVHTFLWMILPWVVALFWQLVRGFPAFRRARFDLNRLSPAGPAPGFMTIWLIAPIVLMSFSKTKLPQYIFFVLPAAAFIVGKFLKDYVSEAMSDRAQRGFSIYTFVLILILSAIAVVIVTVMFPIGQPAWNVLLGIVLVGLIALGLFSLIGKKRALLISALCLLIGLAHLTIMLHVSPAMLAYQPYKEFAADLTRMNISDQDIYFVGKNIRSSFPFYSARHALFVQEVDSPTLLEETNGGRSIYIITPEDMKPKIEEAGYSVEVLSTRDYYHTSLPTKKFLLAKTRTDAGFPLILARLSRSCPDN